MSLKFINTLRKTSLDITRYGNTYIRNSTVTVFDMDNAMWWNETGYVHPGSYSRNCFEEDAPIPSSYPATGGRKINSRTIICLVQVLCGPCIVPLLLRHWANGDPTVPWGEWPQDNEIALRCPLFLFGLTATLQQPLTVMCQLFVYVTEWLWSKHVMSNGCISLL